MKNTSKALIVFTMSLILNIWAEKPIINKEINFGIKDILLNIGFNITKKQKQVSLSLEEEYEQTYEAYLENSSDPAINKKLANLIVSLSMVKKEDQINFEYVAGFKEPKEELSTLIDFLKNTEKYQSLKLKMEKGILLVGDKGNGKTYLAKSIAGQANVTLFYINCLDVVEKWPNLLTYITKELVVKIQNSVSGPAILFFDDIDLIATKSYPLSIGFLLQTISNLTCNNIVVIGTTRDKEILDEQFFRTGRFEKIIYLDYPDISERESILKLYTSKLLLDNSVDLRSIAIHTSGLTRRQIIKLINDAVINCIGKSREVINFQDFGQAIENMDHGQKWETISQSEQERRITAYHEAGHALLQILLFKDHSHIQMVTIGPRRDGPLGFTSWSPTQDIISLTKEKILEKVQISLAGKAAEEIIFGISTAGAGSDLFYATDLVKYMICECGMSDKLGLVSNNPWSKNYSEKTAELIDQEIKDTLDSCYKKTINLLFENKEKLDIIAKELLEKETLYFNQIYKLLGIAK